MNGKKSEPRPGDRPPVIRERSAGGVVIRGKGAEAQFLAIKPAHRDRWQLPKGRIDPGESSEFAATREVREEGGVHAKIVTFLDAIKFFYQMNGHRYWKTVEFYLMEYNSGDPSDHDHEVQEARWFSVSEGHRLAFPSERGLVQKANLLIAGETVVDPSSGVDAKPSARV